MTCGYVWNGRRGKKKEESVVSVGCENKVVACKRQRMRRERSEGGTIFARLRKEGRKDEEECGGYERVLRQEWKEVKRRGEEQV